MVDWRLKRVEESVKLKEDRVREVKMSVVDEHANRVLPRVSMSEEVGERMQEFSVSVPGSETTKCPL